jgi:hypothetical protein
MRNWQRFSKPGFLHTMCCFSGTCRVGEYLRKNVGTVTVGSQADLILLDANPLRDVANVRKEAGVMLIIIPVNECDRLVTEIDFCRVCIVQSLDAPSLALQRINAH